MKKVPAIKPCPFCGSEAVIDEENPMGNLVTFYISCSNEKCSCNFSTPYDLRRNAIKDWNKRKRLPYEKIKAETVS